jgi:hypothetical protein
MLVPDISSAADSTDPSMAPSRCLSAEERSAPAAAASPTSTKAIARPVAPELGRSGDQPDDAGSLRLQLHAALKADDPDDGVGACGQVAHQDVEPAALARGPELRRTARNGVGQGSSELRGGLLLAYGAAADVSLAGLSCGRRRNAATAARPSARVPMPVMPVPIAQRLSMYPSRQRTRTWSRSAPVSLPPSYDSRQQ